LCPWVPSVRFQPLVLGLFQQILCLGTLLERERMLVQADLHKSCVPPLPELPGKSFLSVVTAGTLRQIAELNRLF
jgi:hypothetical protein